MAVKDNSVFQKILPICSPLTLDLTPESVLFGYVKLLRMPKNNLDMFWPETELDDVNAAREVLEEYDLDPALIRSGLLALKTSVSYEENEAAGEFRAYLDSDEPGSSADIIRKAIQFSILPVTELFKTGRTIDEVLSYKPEPRPAAQNNDSDPLYALSAEYRQLSDRLRSSVKGQDSAITKFVRGCFQGDILKETERTAVPRASFFFFGPSGVGKTYLAKVATEALGRPCKVFNMSEYANRETYEQLIGFARTWKNAQPGILTTFVEKNPECILIFDEIEKAHPNALRLFLQILGEGFLTDAFEERDIPFADTIVIFTSNAGRLLYDDQSVNLTMLPARVIISAIEQEKNSNGEPAFPPEICSRLAAGNVILFNHLSIWHIKDIIQKNFDRFAADMKKEYGYDITYDPALPLVFLYSYGSQIDARVASVQSENFLKNELYELIRHFAKLPDGPTDPRSIHFSVDMNFNDPDILRLFDNNEEGIEMMVFADRTVRKAFGKKKGLVLRCPEKKETALTQLEKRDLTAVFIDPLYGNHEGSTPPLSIADYDSEGVRLFHDITEHNRSVPVFILDVNETLSETDRQTFILEGAADTIQLDTNDMQAFKERYNRLASDLYMQKESREFSSKGWVLDYKTLQNVAEGQPMEIVLYDLKKKQAVDTESRGSVLSEEERPGVRFDDVIGAQNAKDELRYFIQYLKKPKKFRLNNRKIPKGILLYGPSGTGKTMLARAMAGESNVTFIQTTATSQLSKWRGESQENIRRLFERARKYAPAILFIDEIDAIGKKRTGEDTYAESILNALLTEMDGFVQDASRPVFVLAATNFGITRSSDTIDGLDEALLRRFDNRIKVDLPTRDERLQYLEVRTKKLNITISEEVMKNIADRTPGQSLAILENIIDLACRNADTRMGSVTDHDLLEAYEDYMHGEKKLHDEAYYYSVAIHETGHAFVTYMTGGTPAYITIESRGDFDGYIQENTENVTNYSRTDLLNKICTMLAGRAAEQVFFGEEEAANTGASSDLRQASELAFQYICTYGMNGKRLIVLSRQEVLYSPLAESYTEQANAILQEQFDRAVQMIASAKELVGGIASVLMKESHFTGERFTAVLAGLQKKQDKQ